DSRDSGAAVPVLSCGAAPASGWPPRLGMLAPSGEGRGGRGASPASCSAGEGDASMGSSGAPPAAVAGSGIGVGAKVRDESPRTTAGLELGCRGRADGVAGSSGGGRAGGRENLSAETRRCCLLWRRASAREGTSRTVLSRHARARWATGGLQRRKVEKTAMNPPIPHVAGQPFVCADFVGDLINPVHPPQLTVPRKRAVMRFWLGSR